ncbi:MAG: hypothetical protein RCG15_07505 [Candidatus Rickettsia vulgarisii]
MLKWIYTILILIPSYNIYANLIPLGFELNKATIFDVQKLYISK